jgi:TonB family protein
MVMKRKFWAAAAAVAAGIAWAQTSAPRVIERADPGYTDEAQAAKVEGSVLLSITIGTDGMAHDINVVKKLGSGLDEKAVEAVQKWKFQPGMKDGLAVNTRAQIEVNFKLK